MINRLLLFSLFLTLLLTGCGKAPAAEPASLGIPVSIQKVGLMDFNETAYFVGELASSQEYDIPTGQPGKIQKVLVKAGDQVSKGQSLFIIEHDQLLVDLRSQETQLKNLVALTELQLTEAQKQFDSVNALYEQGAASKDNYDQTRLKLDQARFNAANAKESLKSTTSKLRTQISDATVKSPVRGMVASSSIQEGQDAGNITAMKIVGTDGMVVNASVPESIIAMVKLGQTASISFGEGSTGIAEGRVIRVDSVPGNQSHLYGVEIQLSTVDPALRSGMYAEVSLTTAIHSQSVGIPKNALRKDDQGPFVVIETQGKAAHKTVTTGLVTGEWIEIIEGLHAGDSLIVKGQTYLKDGDPVKVVQ